MSEQRKYRNWTAQQKLEIVLAGLRGDRSVKELCREHEISESLLLVAREAARGGRRAARGKEERARRREQRRQDRASWSGRSAARPTSWRSRGKLARLGVSERVARSRELVARGFRRRGRGACRCRSAARRSTGRRSRDGAAAAAARRSGRGGDRRGGAREPDRRLPDGRRRSSAGGSAGR